MWDKLSRDNKPELETISAYVNNALWDELLARLERSYAPKVSIEYSGCAIPGWNVKVKKAGRSLCTLYPARGEFQALVVIGQKEKHEMELTLPTMSESLQQLYQNTKEGMGQRWLIIDVTTQEILEDTLRCIAIRRQEKPA